MFFRKAKKTDKRRKLFSVFLLAMFLFSLMPPLPMAGAGGSLDDPKDLGWLSLWMPLMVDGNEMYFHGYWTIYLQDYNYNSIGTAEDLAVAKDFTNTGDAGDIWNYVAMSKIDEWTEVLGGNLSFVQNYCSGPMIKTIRADYYSKSSERVHIRDLVKANGAYTSSFDPDSREVVITTTPPPDANISYDGYVEVGKEETFTLSGSGYAAGDRGISDWNFKTEDGQQISSGGSTFRLNKTATYTFNKPGTYKLTLTVWDNVKRQGTASIVVNVISAGGEAPQPLDPPTSGPWADFDMPQRETVGNDVDITNTSQASPGHTIERADWEVTPGNYSGNLGKSGGTVAFEQEGVYDVTLTIWDDEDRSDSITKTIFIEEAPPPPPPPNEEPIAKFDMPSHCKQGDTVDVINLSSDDGEIVDVDWDVDPSSGAEPNLGFDGGTITFTETGEYTVTLTVKDDDGATDTDTDTIEVENKPPKAKISIPNEVVQGEDIEIKSTSYDPDGEIVNYQWSVSPQEGMVGTLEGEQGGTVYFDVFQDYTITLTVEDEWGLTDTATEIITVKPAVPEAYFEWNGSPKQNRKITFDATGSLGSTRYPIDWTLAQWEFIPPQGVSQDAIKVVNSPDLSIREVMFKESGDYTVRLAVTNTAGNTSEWYEEVIPVSPDAPPVVDFYVPSTVIRDGENESKAEIELADSSYSPDGDVISKRVWKYRYDSDNDDSFTDETWVTLDVGNNPNPTLYTKDVGKYQFELYAEEGFGQDTIREFITPEDLRWGDTSSKPLAKKKVEVLNQRPVVSFDAITKKKVDIVFAIGEVDSEKIEDLKGKITQHIEAELVDANVDYGTINSEATSTISTNDAGAAEIFNNWQKYPINPDSKFDAGWRLSGDEIYTTANVHWTGFWDDENQNTEDVVIEFDVMTEQHQDPWGFTFRMTSHEYDTYSFYAVEWTPYHDEISLSKITRWKPYASDPTHGGPVYHGTIGAADGWYDNYGGGDRQAEALRECEGEVLVAVPFNVEFGRWDHAKIIVNGNYIQVWINGNLLIDYTDYNNPLLKGSYGPYTASQYNTHFKNVTITKGSRKSLDEVLKEPSWRNDALHFIVNISDVEYPELNDPEKASVIQSRLFNDEIHYCVMGTNANKSQTEDVIKTNDNRGTFVYNTNMDTGLNQVADYIIDQVNAYQGKESQYILLNEEIQYKTYYSDNEKDPEYQRRWKYDHDPYYFENSMGLASYDGQFIGAPVSRFDKVGKYDVVFQSRDNPKNDDRFDEYRKWSYMPLEKLTLYVHRRPLALYSWNLNLNTEIRSYQDSNIDFSNEDGSYADWSPNFEASAGETIKTIEFRTPEANDDKWRGEMVVKGYKDGSWYIIKDYSSSYQYSSSPISDTLDVSGQGYTKVQFYFEMYDSAGSAYGNPGDSYYKITTGKQILSGDIQLNDYSYDPDYQTEPGKGIAEKEWKWKLADEIAWHTGMLSSIEPDKIYLVSLRVKDVEGVWSKPNVKVIDTRSGNMPPVAQFTVDPNPLPLGKSLKYNDLSYDPDGDDLVTYKWRSQKDGGAWADHGSNPPTTFGALGEYRVELKVQDENGVWSEPFYQLVTVIPGNTPPIAEFAMSPNPLPLDMTLSYNDTSYDPDGDPIVAREWQYHRVGESWLNGQPTVFSGLGIGDYQIRLRVKDQPALAQMTPSWSNWCVRDLQVIAGNQKPVAQFTVLPNPVIADEPVMYTDTSYDPEGAGISERVWRVEKMDGTLMGEYHNTLPPTVFASTGWSEGGVGNYRIGLRVKDISPNGISPPLWSDWAWKTLTVILPLKGTGEITPNPALSGYRIHVKVETEGFAEDVRVKFPNDKFWNGDEITLTPDSPVNNKYNTFRGTYLTDVKTPDGVYNVTATVRRFSLAPDTVMVPLTAAIQGDIYDQIKVRIRYSR